MYEWLKPRLAVPVHGEDRHMTVNASLAREAGVPHQLVGRNGDLFDLMAGKRQPAAAPVGRLWLDEEAGKLRRVE
jgi:ribonuclease J